MLKNMKAGIIVFAMMILLSGCQNDKNDTMNKNSDVLPTIKVESDGTNNENVLDTVNYFDDQTAIDQSLQDEVKKGYTFEKPMVIVNPYGTSPLTAVAIFSTTSKIGGSITVKGKYEEDDLKGSFVAGNNHIVPIYGLYAGGTTEVVLSLSDGTSTTVNIKTDTLDFSTDGFEVEMKDSASYDYSKLTFVCDFNGDVAALDSKGDLRWLYNNGGTLGVKVLTNGHLALPTSYTLRPLYYKSGILEIDLLGKVYNEYAIPGGMHHDIFELSNGNLLVASDRSSFETVEDYVVEIDRKTGEIVWNLDLANLIDPSEGGSINRSDEDWFHNNSLWYDEATDTLLLSGRHVDAIISVDKSEKKLKWILGDSEGWSEKYQKYFFTPTGDNFEWQYAQHQASMLSNGNIMCFDNGAGRTKTVKEDKKVIGSDVYSRAVVFQIDEKNMTIEQVWEYGKELGGEFYSEWVSGAISLENNPNNIWVTSGANLYNPDENDYDYGPSDMFKSGLIPSTNIFQVKDNKLVFKMKLDFLSYRTLRLSPYHDTGNYDVTLDGQYLGNLGISTPVDVEIDLTKVDPAENCTLSLDPTKLTFSASYTTNNADELEDSYLVLRRGDGTVTVYPAQQSTTESSEAVTVKVNGWISTKGLSGASYDIYVVLGGKVYNTGYKAVLFLPRYFFRKLPNLPVLELTSIMTIKL